MKFPKNNIPWHSFPLEEIFKILKTDPKFGLSHKEVRERQKIFGLNKIKQPPPFSSFEIFINQFKNPLVYILILAGIVVLFLENHPQNLIDSFFIFIAILINSIFGFLEERKSSKTFEKLKKILKTKAVVIREGIKKEVFQEELVVGDIILFKAGDKIPADGRLIEGENIEVSEAVLTGEWWGVEKSPNQVFPKETPLSERKNMVFSGCFVERGEGKAVVVATGEDTEIGKISSLLKETREEKTPLQRKLFYFSKFIGGIILIGCFFIYLGGILRGEKGLEMFETSIAVAVGGIPEGLPVVMTIILAIGMERLARKKGLLKKLQAVESLGSTSVILLDKTRTLTKGKMEGDEVVVYKKIKSLNSLKSFSSFSFLFEIISLCNEAFVENPSQDLTHWRVKGSPTDKALLETAAKKGFFKPLLEKKYHLIKSFPFDTQRKYQAKILKKGKDVFLFVCGAPEKLIDLSLKVIEEGKEEFLSSEHIGFFLENLKKITSKGKRVIGVGYKKLNKKEMRKDVDEIVRDITFFGFLSFKDPIREDVKEALKISQQAGLRVVIVTGDHKNTAKYVAQEIGMEVKDYNIMEGKEIDFLSEEEFKKRLREIKIFARVTPSHKLKIVKAWQEEGEIVAMVGDGVNDAPALKRADIGVSLGSGTEVAKEASDLVLLNDSFGIIVKAIEEGRVIFDNLRKAITFVLADSFASLILVGMSIILGWPLPILWMQILWNNVVEDTLPTIAFAFEPKEKEIMKKRFSFGKMPLLSKEMKILIFATGVIDQFLALGLFFWLWKIMGMDLDYVRTMIFGTICIDTAFVIFSYKSLRKNIWKINLWNNKFLFLSSLFVIGSFISAVYFPPFQILLRTVPLSLNDWLILIAISLLGVGLIEMTKWWFIARKDVD